MKTESKNMYALYANLNHNRLKVNKITDHIRVSNIKYKANYQP